MIELGKKELIKSYFMIKKKTSIPLIILINKIDLFDQDFVSREIGKYEDEFSTAKILPISALNNFNLELVKDLLVDLFRYLHLIMTKMH